MRWLEFLADLAPYLPSGYQNFHWDENGQTASGGKAAMTLVATQSTSWLEEESSATAGKWGYLALKSNKGTVGGIIDDYCWSVCVDSQNKEGRRRIREVLHRYRRSEVLHPEVQHLRRH